ncbi:conserved hypothetical protein [delta proteobacterium NaphS2]|nr:conserved hypothetical protein [delta proteobacterium NaphS2]
MLSLRHFTFLQVLFLAIIYAPALLGFLGAIAFSEIGEFFMTAHLWQFLAFGFLLYLSALVLPFVVLLWVILIKRFMDRSIFGNSVRPGTYPKWSRMYLRIWCMERLEMLVLRLLGVLFRSTPLTAYVLRRLGASVGRNLHCAQDVALSGPLELLSIENDVTIQTGACIQVSRWVGEELIVGPVTLENGCKIGMRAAVSGHVIVGRNAWITPLTPILGNVGANEMWEGAPARLAVRFTGLKRTAHHCRSTCPVWFLEILNILMQIFLDLFTVLVPTAAVTWFVATFIPVRETALASVYFKITPLLEIVGQIGLYAFITTWVTLVLVLLLGCLFIRSTPASPGLYPTHGLKTALLLYRLKKMNQIQRLWTWTIFGQYLRALAGLHFTRVGGSECDVMHNLVPELASAHAQVFWAHGCFTNMLDEEAGHLKIRQLDMPANFFSSNNCVAGSGYFPTNFLLGVSTPGSDIRFRRQMPDALTHRSADYGGRKSPNKICRR